MKRALIGILVLVIGSAGCSTLPPDSPGAHEAPARPNSSAAPALAPATQSADPAWAEVSRVLEHPGVVKEGVYVVTIPRDDLDVSIEGMGMPTAAGIECVFYFYRCPCGKMNVAGQFVTADYEADDVVDALRQNAALKVATIAPMLLYERPRLMLIRFQGEGEASAMAGNLREALRWTGRERMAPRKMD